MADPRELFPTTSINVPNLVPLMERLRDENCKRAVTFVHVASSEEGDWICSTAAARLKRYGDKMIGPEPGKIIDLVETAIRSKVPCLFAGEMRYEEDARALRAAATLGIKAVAYIVRPSRTDAANMITVLGSWSSFDIALLSEYE
ncbi:MAG TPA: hypothetical protein VF741_00645 [Candidatus Aquilonibacter sp.]